MTNASSFESEGRKARETKNGGRARVGALVVLCLVVLGVVGYLYVEVSNHMYQRPTCDVRPGC